MTVTRLDRALPWTGALAGVSWIAQSSLLKVTEGDTSGGATTRIIEDNVVRNHAAIGCLVLMGMCLLAFATVVRSVLRTAEAAQPTWSGIAYGGWVVVVAGISQMVAVSWALVIGAAGGGDEEAARVLGHLQFFGWAGLGVGLAAAFVATGIGGIRGGVLPRWFGVVTVVLGVLGALGNAGIPPGGLVTYVLLPLWLVTASVVLVRRRGVDVA